MLTRDTGNRAMTQKMDRNQRVLDWGDIYDEISIETEAMPVDQVDRDLARMGYDLSKLYSRSIYFLGWKCRPPDAQGLSGSVSDIEDGGDDAPNSQLPLNGADVNECAPEPSLTITDWARLIAAHEEVVDLFRVADQLRPSALDARANLYLRAVHCRCDFTDEEYAAARDHILDVMANSIAAESKGHSPDRDLLGMLGDIDPKGRKEYRRHRQPESVRMLMDEMLAAIVSVFQSSATPCASPRREGVQFRIALASVDISQGSSRKQQIVETRRGLIAKHRMFGAAAIGAAVLLLFGAYCLVWFPRNDTSSESHVAAIAPAFVSAQFGSPVPELPNKQDFVSASQGVASDLSRAVTATTRILSPVLSSNFVPSPPAPGSFASESQGTAQPRTGDHGSSVAARAGTPDNVEDIVDTVRRGEVLIVNGEILAARSVLKKAADANSAQAALALGMTYDPVELEELKARLGPP
jgi:hypothetical protein